MATRRLPSLATDCFNDVATCRDGIMLFNRHDQYVGASLRKYGEFSRGEAQLFRQLVLPGSTVVEAGANIGAHTILLSRLAGPAGTVQAFEPQRLVFQTLCANLALNGCVNVYARQTAVGAQPGEIRVPALAPDQPANFGGLSLVGAPGGEKVRLERIDDLGLEACHFIKMDIEGMEADALAGAAATVQRFRPHLYVENDRPDRSAALMALLRSWNYDLYWHLPPLFSPDNFAGDPENIFGDIVSVNVLGLAAERHIDVPDVRKAVLPSGDDSCR
jgi:FkbM family methyltransferase